MKKKQEDMRKKYNNDKLKFYIGDVRDTIQLKELLLVLIMSFMRQH